MFGVLQGWLEAQGLGEPQARALTTATEIAAVILLAILANIVVKRLVVRSVTMLVARTQAGWDDVLVRRRAFHRLSHLAPAIVLYHFSGAVLADYPAAVHVVRQGCFVYITVVTAWAISGLLEALNEIAQRTTAGRELPTTSFMQVAKIVVFSLAAIGVVAIIIGRSPLLLFSGLGAMTAVLMLVFKDPILGFVAGIQLSANRMVSLGDWIEMPKYGADGDVMEVALTTVKIRNWDKTVTTIPTYALISESFKNWRGMSESGGRRIKRAVHIDVSSIRFCDDAMLERLSRIQYMREYLDSKREEVARWNAEHDVDPSSPVNGRRLTNVGTFRAYIDLYLRNHPMIRTDMTFLVRQLAPTAEGLPIEIYVFSRDQRWTAYEGIQGDIFDHLFAVAREFDLRVFQNPSGWDIRSAVAGLQAPDTPATGDRTA